VSPYLGLVLAYLAGSIPAAYIAGKLTKGIDLRQHGSGNLGATNVYRVLGAKIAVAVLLFDAAKGALPVLYFPRLLDPSAVTAASATWWSIAFGIAAIAGHVRPVFLLWNGGGKGVATALGVMLGVAPWIGLMVLVIWLFIAGVWRYSSGAAITAFLLLPVLALLTKADYNFVVFCMVVSGMILSRHRGNMVRLWRGTEPKIGQRKEPAG